MDLVEPRKRQQRIDIREARQALRVVEPIRRQIGPWQTRLARLLAYGTRLSLTGHVEPWLCAEAETLHRTVERQRLQLDEEMRALPPEIAVNGHLIDTVRALASVSQGTERAMKLLAGETTASRPTTLAHGPALAANRASTSGTTAGR